MQKSSPSSPTRGTQILIYALFIVASMALPHQSHYLSQKTNYMSHLLSIENRKFWR